MCQARNGKNGNGKETGKERVLSFPLTISFFPVLSIRDVRGKEREKTGMGKKLERNAFFPFPFLHFLTTFFPVFGENRQERVKKGWNGKENGGKMWNGEERPFHAVPNCRILRDSGFFAI